MIPESRLGAMNLTGSGWSRQRRGVRQPPAALDGTDPKAPEGRRTPKPGGPSAGSREGSGVSWRRVVGRAFLACCVAALASCRQSSVEQARQLVERYNTVVSEAYRRADVKLIDPVAGPNEGRKITGLIGVRLDLGLTLDSELLRLEVVGVETSKGEMRVRTRERWRYRDLRIGSGDQVGEASLDSYEMLYLFKRTGRAWLVDEIRFTAPPRVGRRQMPWLAGRASRPGPAQAINEQEVTHP